LDDEKELSIRADEFKSERALRVVLALLA